jgi:hypothetical protein
MNHIPHFAESYFNLFSLMLWSHDYQLMIESKSNSSTTQRERVEFKALLIEESLVSRNYPLWIKELVHLVDDKLNIATISSRPCFPTITAESKGWFLHPSDALLLGSYLLNEDVCKYRGLGNKMLARTYQMKLGMLDRRVDRRILNFKAITDHQFAVCIKYIKPV